MPAHGKQGAVVTAVCLALGSTALLTWAFSIFSEDKSKKRPGNAPNQSAHVSESPASNSASDRKSIVLENQSAIQATKHAGQPYPNPNKLNYPLYDEFAAKNGDDKIKVSQAEDEVNTDPSADKRSSFLQNVPKFEEKYNVSLTRTSIADTVISEQITAATEGTPVPVQLEHQVSQLDNKVTTYEEKIPATQEMVVEESSNGVPASVSCRSLEKAVRMYTPSPTRVSPTGVDNCIKELDMKVSETIEMSSTVPNLYTAPNSATISRDRDSKTYEYNGGPKRDRPLAGGQSGVDNSISTIDAAPVPTHNIELADETRQTASLQSSYYTAPPRPKLQCQEGSTISPEISNSGQQEPVALQKPCDEMIIISPLNSANGELPTDGEGSVDKQLAKREVDEHMDNLTVDVNYNLQQQPAERAETSITSGVQGYTSPGTHSAEVFAIINNENAKNQISKYYSPVQLDRELSPDSLDSFSLERNEMRFLLGVDKRLDSSVSVSGPNTPSVECESPGTRRSHLFVNVVTEPKLDSKLEKAEYFSPPKLERELTPSNSLSGSIESSPHRLVNSTSLERSELHLRVKGANVESEEPELSVSRVELELSTNSPSNTNSYTAAAHHPQIQTDNGEDAVEESLTAKLVIPTHGEFSEAHISIGCPDTDVTDNAMLELPSHSGVDETSSVSSESVEHSRTQMTETEEMIETSVEETVTMVITGVVVNPGSEEEIILSMHDAVDKGLLDLEKGIYHNSTTGEHMSFVDAMNSGYIKMGPKKVEKSEEKVKSVGIIKITTTRETIPYKIKGATDTRDGKMYHVFQATRRKILDVDKGTFVDLKTGEKMLIGDAVDLHLVEVEYDMAASDLVQEEITTTYSVHAVVDQKAKTKIEFHEAVSRGLIDQDTGEYINNLTREHVPVQEAITKGFIKATLAKDANEISIDNMGSKVTERGINAIKKKVLNPLKVLKEIKPSHSDH